MLKQLGIKYFLSLFIFLLCGFLSQATHLVGGEIKVKYMSGTTYEITLTCYRDCAPGNSPFDLSIIVGMYDLLTDEEFQSLSLDLVPPTDTLELGDACYTPPGICVEKAIYQTTAEFQDNSNGYYLSWQRFARNYTLINIVSKGTIGSQAGMTYYAEIPDPALHKSTPEFGSYPRAYFCVNQLNVINFSCVDVDTDSLVYSLVTPLSAIGDGSLATPPPAPKPYPFVTWISVPSTPYYNATNMIGGFPVMAIDSTTGILTATPDRLGLFVFAVRVEEYDRSTKEKVGEVRRDVQFKVLANCNTDLVPEFTSPLTDYYKIYAGDSVCFNVALNDPNTGDSVFFSASSEMLISAPNEPNITFSPQRGKKSIQTNFCIETSCSDIREMPYRITFNGNDSSCYGKNFIKKTVDFYIYTIDGTLKDPFPNVFTPNGDGQNEFLRVNATVNDCYDSFVIKIYDRWGDKVFESKDFTFSWNGTHYRTGKELPEGIYYYSLKGFFRDRTVERQGYVSLFK